MNKRIKELMIEAGYASPELAGRANKLVELVIKECVDEILKWKAEPFPYDPEFGAKEIKNHFGIKD